MPRRRHGTDFQGYLTGLRGQGDRGAMAFFDLDRTLITRYSVAALVWERLRSGSVPLRQVLGAAGAFLGYGLGRRGYHGLLDAVVRGLAGESHADLVHLGERAFRLRVNRWVYREAQTLADTHRQQGHHVVIVTSATRYQAAPIAAALGIEELCCTELEIREGRVTGKSAPCFGIDKLTAAERVSRDRSAELARAYFYSDSADDLPLLEAVGRPVVVNPRPQMARLAQTRGWPLLMFTPPADGPAARAARPS
jgi:putative phosphoserine phosphatase / 1-acylglycerol-3-phosphate O-acyltransferase